MAVSPFAVPEDDGPELSPWECFTCGYENSPNDDECLNCGRVIR